MRRLAIFLVFFVLLVLLVLLAATGCHKKGATATQLPESPAEKIPGLGDYRKQLTPLVAAESAALAALAAKTGSGYTDDVTLLAVLHDTTLPKYREFVDGLGKITAIEPVVKLHERLLAAARAELAILEKSEKALTRGDGTAVLLLDVEQRKVRAELDGVLADYDAIVAAPVASASSSHAAK